MHQGRYKLRLLQFPVYPSTGLFRATSSRQLRQPSETIGEPACFRSLPGSDIDTVVFPLFLDPSQFFILSFQSRNTCIIIFFLEKKVGLCEALFCIRRNIVRELCFITGEFTASRGIVISWFRGYNSTVTLVLENQ